MSEQLNVDYWINKKIWENHEIPYLFLGYNPKPYDSRPLDDYVVLNEEEQELYDNYLKLINEAITLGKLIPASVNLRGFCSLRAADIKEWRKDVSYIKPKEIYLEMENAISERQKDAQDSSEVEQSSESISEWTELKIELHTNTRMTIENLKTGKKCKLLAAELGFTNKRTNIGNKQWEILLRMAAGEIFTSKEKATISHISKSLKNYFGISHNPFTLSTVDGYKPKFTLTENIRATDNRAKENAVHIPFDDKKNYEHQDDLSVRKTTRKSLLTTKPKNILFLS